MPTARATSSTSTTASCRAAIRKLDWSKAVDGRRPESDWQGILSLEELPQVLNPISGYVQNCNQSPYTTTDDQNPEPGDLSRHIVGETTWDNRRAKVSRHLLRQAHDVTFDDWQKLAFDTTMYWPLEELPIYERKFRKLKEDRSGPGRAGRAVLQASARLGLPLQRRLDAGDLVRLLVRAALWRPAEQHAGDAETRDAV